LPPDAHLAAEATSAELAVRAALRGERDSWVEHHLEVLAGWLRRISRSAVYRAEMARRLGLPEGQSLRPVALPDPPPELPAGPLRDRVLRAVLLWWDKERFGVEPSDEMVELGKAARALQEYEEAHGALSSAPLASPASPLVERVVEVGEKMGKAWATIDRETEHCAREPGCNGSLELKLTLCVFGEELMPELVAAVAALRASREGERDG
jgi:hypothetical protein